MTVLSMGPEFKGRAAFVPQNFQTYNRSDMFFPSGARLREGSATWLAAATAATPFMGRTMNVHSAPVTYQKKGTVTRVQQRVGMSTPAGGGVSGS